MKITNSDINPATAATVDAADVAPAATSVLDKRRARQKARENKKLFRESGLLGLDFDADVEMTDAEDLASAATPTTTTTTTTTADESHVNNNKK